MCQLFKNLSSLAATLQNIVGAHKIGAALLEQFAQYLVIVFIVFRCHKGAYRKRAQRIVHTQGSHGGVFPSREGVCIGPALTGAVQVYPAHQVYQGINKRSQGINALSEQTHLLSVIAVGHIAEGFLYIFEWQNGDDRSKLLFVVYPHFFIHRIQHSGENKIAAAFAAPGIEHFGAVLDSVVNEFADVSRFGMDRLRS